MDEINIKDSSWIAVENWANTQLNEIIGSLDEPGYLETAADRETAIKWQSQATVLRELLGLPKELLDEQ